jgi:hypothetical protein
MDGVKGRRWEHTTDIRGLRAHIQLDDVLADFVAMVKAAWLASSSGRLFRGRRLALRSAPLPQGGTFERGYCSLQCLAFAPHREIGWRQVGAADYPAYFRAACAQSPRHSLRLSCRYRLCDPVRRTDLLTGSYSFRLLRAFTTADYAADLKAASSRIAVLVG